MQDPSTTEWYTFLDEPEKADARFVFREWQKWSTEAEVQKVLMAQLRARGSMRMSRARWEHYVRSGEIPQLQDEA